MAIDLESLSAGGIMGMVSGIISGIVKSMGIDRRISELEKSQKVLDDKKIDKDLYEARHGDVDELKRQMPNKADANQCVRIHGDLDRKLANTMEALTRNGNCLVELKINVARMESKIDQLTKKGDKD